VGEFEGEQLSQGDIASPVTLEKDERNDGKEVGEDEVGGEVHGGAVLNFRDHQGGDEDGGVVCRRGDTFRGAVLAVVDGDENGPGQYGASEEEEERGPEKGEELLGGAEVSWEAQMRVRGMEEWTYDGCVETDNLENGKLARAKRRQDPSEERLGVVHLMRREAC
jgi:hypothetical protein